MEKTYDTARLDVLEAKYHGGGELVLRVASQVLVRVDARILHREGSLIALVMVCGLDGVEVGKEPRDDRWACKYWCELETVTDHVDLRSKRRLVVFRSVFLVLADCGYPGLARTVKAGVLELLRIRCYESRGALVQDSLYLIEGVTSIDSFALDAGRVYDVAPISG